MNRAQSLVAFFNIDHQSCCHRAGKPQARYASCDRRGYATDGYESEPIHHSVVVFENGRITQVGQKRKTEIPADAIVIDAGGRTIMPGLIDSHIHIEITGYGDYGRFYEFMNAGDRASEFMRIAAKQMMRAGVTSARDLGSPFEAFEVRERIRRGEIPEPRLTLSGPWITRIDYDGVINENEFVISSPRELRKAPGN